MKKYIIMTIILILSLSCFIGCSNLKEREETRIVKEVISFVEEQDTVLSINEEKEETMTTIYGEKSVQEHLTEISERANGLLQTITTAEPESFTFNYDRLMEYMSGTDYGHKGNSSSGENENTEIEIVCYCENGRILEDSANAYQGEWTISPTFPKIGDTISDDSNKDWIIEGFYWDEEYTQPIPVLEGVEYSGQETIVIYAKMTPAEA